MLEKELTLDKIKVDEIFIFDLSESLHHLVSSLFSSP